MFRTKEKRHFIRVPQEYLVSCQKFTFENEQNNVINVKTKDLSASGLLFETNMKYKEKDILKMEIKIPGWENFKSKFYKPIKLYNKPLVVLGSVVRVISRIDGKFDIGICFSCIDKGYQTILSKFINKVIKFKK